MEKKSQSSTFSCWMDNKDPIVCMCNDWSMVNKNNGNLRTPSTLALNAMVICEVSFLYLAICCWTIVWSNTILYYKVIMFYPSCICCIRHHYINTSLISWACLSMHSDHFKLMAREKNFKSVVRKFHFVFEDCKHLYKASTMLFNEFCWQQHISRLS